jgi:hypothetical protein
VLDIHQRDIAVIGGTKEGEKHEPLHIGFLTRPKQIELSLPISLVNAVGIRWPAGGGIDVRIHAIKCVIKAGRLKKITPRELTTPFL